MVSVSNNTKEQLGALFLNSEEIVNAIKACAKDLHKQTGIKTDKVNVNINGQHIEMIKKRLCFDINTPVLCAS